MPYCTSCGSDIPEGQGRSCSLCYGDVDYGSDGYYRDYLEQQDRHLEDRRAADDAAEEQQRDEDVEE